MRLSISFRPELELLSALYSFLFVRLFLEYSFTSSWVILPPVPLPLTRFKSTPISLASLLIDGEAGITEIEQFRKDYGEEVKKAGGKLTMTSIITKIVSHALIKFPKFNCSIDMDRKEIIYKSFYNIGIAVDTDRGLLVPVIKDVNKKNIVEIPHHAISGSVNTTAGIALGL